MIYLGPHGLEAVASFGFDSAHLCDAQLSYQFEHLWLIAAESLFPFTPFFQPLDAGCIITEHLFPSASPRHFKTRHAYLLLTSGLTGLLHGKLRGQ